MIPGRVLTKPTIPAATVAFLMGKREQAPVDLPPFDCAGAAPVPSLSEGSGRTGRGGFCRVPAPAQQRHGRGRGAQDGGGQEHLLERRHEGACLSEAGVEGALALEQEAGSGDAEDDAEGAHHLVDAAGDALVLAGDGPHDEAHVGHLDRPHAEPHQPAGERRCRGGGARLRARRSRPSQGRRCRGTPASRPRSCAIRTSRTVRAARIRRPSCC